MGSLLAALRRRSRAETPSGQLAEGAVGLAAVVAASALGAVATRAAVRRLPRGTAIAGEAAALSTLLALRGCARPSTASAGRSRRGTSTPLAQLPHAISSAATPRISTPSELSGAAIQSLAENLSDSVVAPLLAYAAGGLPAAAAYRALNTADAMWGYRTPELLYRGRTAARADDVANLIPARLTALYIAARSPRPREALRVALRDHGLAPSPNGGWPMAAMAGGLGVRLAKRGSYDFNAGAPLPVGGRHRRARWRSPVGRALMVQGCTSHAGKSYLTAALCRLLADEGLRVAPFKAQNMSNNAGVTADGRELGRAQIVQAAAARIAPEARMNPVLVKPEADTRSQVVVLGEVDHEISRLPWRERRPRLWPVVRESLHGLLDDYDVVVIEGAGSPAEINLRAGDIVNMAVALEVAGARAAVLRHRPRRRVRAPARHVALPRRGRARAARRLPAQPLPRRRLAARARARSGSRSAPACRRSASSRGSTCRCPRRTASRCRARGGDGRIADRRAAADREPRRVRAARRARALRAHAGRDRGRRGDRDPGHQEHAGRPGVAAHDRPGGRDRPARAAGVPVLGICGGCRCSAAPCAIRTASRAAARRPASACSTS